MNSNKMNFIPKPIAFFCIGFVYYLIVPFLAFKFLDISKVNPVMDVLPHMDGNFFSVEYLIDTVIIFGSFYIGYRVSIKTKRRMNSNLTFDQYCKYTKVPIYIAALMISLICLLTFEYMKNGGRLFTGYESFDVTYLGQISTLTFLAFFYHNFFTNKKIKLIFFGCALFGSSILLGLGSRNVVMNGFISAFLGLTYLNRKYLYSLKTFLIVTLFYFTILFIGVWRTGYELGIDTMLGNFLAEPVFVLSSASVYLDNVISRPIFSFPYDLLLSVVNFVPTFLFPDKINLLNVFLHDIQKYSPFGASSIIVGLYTNFGYLYFFYVVLLGYLYGFLYKKAFESNFFRAIYFSASPLIIFQFYNQYLYSFFKLFVWNSILLPTILFFFLSKVLKSRTTKVNI